mgnify:CR=1 FL=1
MTKSIFITGGSSGIGLSTAREFKKNGYRVGICGRNQQKLDALKGEFEVFNVDVVEREKLQYAIEKFAEGGLDIVFANAGVSHKEKTKIPDFEDCRKIIDININGVLNTFEPAVSIFLKQGHGHLIATSSVAGFNGHPGVGAYGAAKSFTMKLCETFQIDLRRSGIKTICVVPGFIDTPLTQKNNHSMPLIGSSEAIATKIYQAVIKDRANVYYPRTFATLVRALSLLPRGIYRKFMSLERFNYSSKEKAEFFFDKSSLSKETQELQKEKKTFDSPCVSICDYEMVGDEKICQTCKLISTEKSAWKETTDLKVKNKIAKKVMQRRL